MGILDLLIPGGRALDLGLGLSALGWAAAGLVAAWPDPPAPSLAIAALHASAGLLFLRRRAPIEGPRTVGALAALPALLLAAAAWKLGPAPADWPLWTGRFLVLATLWTCWSLLSLGESFAVLPARRALVTRGPFRFVRHPAYLGELLALQTVGAASMRPAIQALCAAAAVPVMLRIFVEEQALAADPGWKAYAAAVRWRLVPGVW